MLRCCLCLVGLGLVFAPSPARAAFDNFGVGDGHSGPKTISGSAPPINVYAVVTAINTVDNAHITLDNVNNVHPGDLLLLWQTAGRGATASAGSPAPNVDITTSPVGQWELARIGPLAGDVAGDGTVHLTAAITGGKFSVNVTQAVVVPEYSSLKFAAGGGTITGAAWDGQRGGIIAFLVSGTFDLSNGTVDASGLGFRGGSVSATTTGNSGCSALDYGNADGAPKGEGIGASSSNGRGAVANGAGGGDCASAGGGGGGNATNGGLGSNSASNGTAGGVGGGSLTYDLKDHLTLGGGGGAGNNAQGAATAGGNGGGAIFIRANAIAAGGAISANGRAGGDGTASDGLGGGGAGGSIYIRVVGNAAICSGGGVLASGGAGGSTTATGVGPGGGGAGGRIFIQSSNSCAINAANFAGGPSGLDGATPQSAHNAQPGGNGFQETAPTGGYCFGFAQCSNGDQACSVANNDYHCVACAVSSDCANPAKPICNGGGTCVACSGDSECASRSLLTPACVSGQCQPCSAKTSVCAGLTPICDNVSGACDGCTATPDNCPSTTPICNGNGSCGDCTGTNVIDANCQTINPKTPICLGPGAGCGPCSDPNQCTLSPTRPVCDLTSDVNQGACIGCTAGSGNFDAQCAMRGTGTTPICAANGACAACAPAGGLTTCPAGSAPICDVSGACRACLANNIFDGDCAARDPNQPVCSAGSCGRCTASAQCTTALLPTCDTSSGNPTSGQCIGCTAGSGNYDAACAAHNINTPICQVDGSCGACTASAQCPTSSPTRPICEAGGGNPGSCQPCGGASGNVDCRARLGTTPFCNGGGGCAACASNAQCNATYPQTPICANSGACVACSSAAQCLALNADTPICDVTTGCRACANSADCEGVSLTTPFCNSPTGNCLPCAGDASCTVATRPACQGDGSCRQCSMSNSSQCNNATPACNFAQGKCVLCTVAGNGQTANSTGCVASSDGHACQLDSGNNVFCGCASDGDCGNATSGRICDGQTHKCKDGCARAPGRNNCPTTQFCTSNDPTGQVTGVCTQACNFDVDCTATPATPFCIDAGGDAAQGHCVACRDSNDCAAPKAICTVATTHECVQCTADDNSACSKFTIGAACLASDVCGCQVDSDCGSPDTGRVCSDTTHACIEGCRGSGGNGCPREMVCSSTDTTIGSCSNAPVDMSMSPVADMSGRPPLAHDLGSNFAGLEGGGLSCAVAGHRDGSDAGEALLFFLLAGAVIMWRRRKA
jgi:hypothetical protein